MEAIFGVKDHLTVAQECARAIALQTFRSAAHGEHQSYTARLQALALAHDLLTQKGWQSVEVAQIAEVALRPFNQDDRLQASGDDVQIGPNRALLIAMVLHELATNAVKYGSLSNADGRVDIVWSPTVGADRNLLKMSWKETGGPAVALPSRRGFGTRMIERALAADGGSSTLEFAQAGLICNITLPVS